MKTRFIAALAAAAFTMTACSVPAVTTSTPAPVPTVTETTTVQITPQDCLDFVEDSETLISLVSEALTVTSQGIEAYTNGDLEEVDKMSDRLDELASEIKVAREAYDSSKAGCQ